MSFSVLPPEVNSALMLAGPGSGPLLAAAEAWDGIGSELSWVASTFSSVTSDLAVGAWQGAPQHQVARWWRGRTSPRRRGRKQRTRRQ
jgi:PPE-repeat protein